MWTGRQRDEEKFNGLLAGMQERGNMADRRREESKEREREMWESESWIREDYLLSYVTT